jgi:Mce-associated membrane protein
MPKATNAPVEVADPPTEAAVVDRDPPKSAADAGAGQASTKEPAVTKLAALRGWATRPRLVLAGLTAVILLLWGTGGWLFVHNRANSDLAAQRGAVLDAARKVATDLTSITGDNAQAQISVLTQESTGNFRDQITTYGSALETILRQAKTGSIGTVSAAGIERIDATSATVLVAVSAKVLNNGSPPGEPAPYRLDMTLRRDGDRWLVSDSRFVQ